MTPEQLESKAREFYLQWRKSLESQTSRLAGRGYSEDACEFAAAFAASEVQAAVERERAENAKLMCEWCDKDDIWRTS